MKEIYEMKGAGRSIRGIAGDLGIARNTVRRYLNSPEAIRTMPRPRRASKLDPNTGYVDRRVSDGLENCWVLHRELKAQGYDGGYSILKSYVSLKRRRRQPDATMRFETAPGKQAQQLWLMSRRRDRRAPLLSALDHAVEHGKQLSHARGDGYLRELPCCHQSLIEVAERRIAAGG